MSRDRIGNSGQEMRVIFLARCFFEIFFVVVSLSSVFYFFFFFSIVRLILFTGYGIDCEFHGQLDFSARFRFYRDFGLLLLCAFVSKFKTVSKILS